MDLKDELIAALKALDPQVDETKAKLELDAPAVAIALLLSEPLGLALVEYIINELEYGENPVYSTTKFVEQAQLERLIECFYTSQVSQALGVLLSLYHQCWVGRQGGDAPMESFRVLKKLEGSDAIGSRTVALNVCLDCCISLNRGSQACDQCGGSNLFQVHKLFLAESARTVIKRGQYLEIYVKECLRKSGVELIGWPLGKHGHKAYTSIRYQVEGERVDVDAHGISQPLALLLCEVKTSQRVLMNELRRVESLLDRLINRLNESSGRSFNHLKFFVTTGEFDRNIHVGSYRRKNWELIDRPLIPGLTEYFTKIQSEL